MMLIIFFIGGLIIGSFLNVVAYRLNLAENFFLGRSHCPHCKKNIAWYDNIPIVSFIILRFKCRDCQEKISWQYPLVEFFTGVLFVLIGRSFFVLEDITTWVTTIYYLGIASFLMVIFVYDWLYMEIPGLVLWPAISWAIIFNLFFDWVKPEPINNVLTLATFGGTLAAFVGFGIFFLMVAISKEKWMGMGDAQLAIFLGLIIGWPQIILALLLAFSFGATIGLGLVMCKKKNMKSQIPFAPFLIAGTFVTMFFYEKIIDWYFNLLSFY
jgi:leader peptidase (prepilin peptidase) / N-methyltransferase